MATLTGKAVSELPAATAANDADLFAISQSGASKKITKSALLGGYLPKTAGAGEAIIGDLYIKSTVEDGYTPSSAMLGNHLFFNDSNSVNIGYLSPYFSPTGEQGIYIVARRVINGTPRNNYLLIANDSAGAPVVQMASSAAWRSALGLGTDGALPVTVGQGGTGQTDVSTTATISSIASAASGATIVAASFSQWGKVGQLYLACKLTSALSSASKQVATLVSGKRPVTFVMAGTTQSNHAVKAVINAAGAITIDGTLAADTNIIITATYLLL